MTQKKDFDAVAMNWDEEPRRVKLALEIADSIMKTLPLSREWDALDFGCGTGLVSMQLAPALRTVTGIDSSKSGSKLHGNKSGSAAEIECIPLPRQRQSFHD